jgi:putrescine transport system ATP-binding protein
MELQGKLGLTFIVVTHDQEEAMTVADRIGVMNAGRLAQVGPPAEVYEQPSSRWVASFIGDVNLIEGRVVSSRLGETVIESLAGGRLSVTQSVDAAANTVVCVALRPEKMLIAATQPDGSENCFAGKVFDIAYLGGTSLYKVRLDNGLDMRATVANWARSVEQPIGIGDRIWLRFAPDACVVLP